MAPAPPSLPGLMKAQALQQHPGHHIACQDPGGGQLGLIDQHLADGAEDAAAEERVEIVHIESLQRLKMGKVCYRSAHRQTAWQMPGMDSP